MTKAKKRDNWGSRMGIIMAVAGSAIGLGWAYLFFLGDDLGADHFLFY